MGDASGSSRELLRHTVGTLAYRGGKAVRGAPAAFAAFRLQEGGRTPVEILAHVGDLFDWAVSLAQGGHAWKDSTPLHWDAEVARFFASLEHFDALHASEALLGSPVERLFQGPIADARTHVGQIAMLRCLSGSPIKGENYFKADIATGCVGANQATPLREFD